MLELKLPNLFKLLDATQGKIKKKRREKTNKWRGKRKVSNCE